MAKFIALRKLSPVEAVRQNTLTLEEKRQRVFRATPDQTKADDLQRLGLTPLTPEEPAPHEGSTFLTLDTLGAYVVNTPIPAVADRAKEILAPDHVIVPELPFALVPPRMLRRYQTRPRSRHYWPEVSGVALAHKNGVKGQGVLVGVLDTGCDADHLELRNKVIDFRYVPLDSRAPTLRASRGFDVDGHGTHVCGIIAGKHVGVAPEVDLMVASVIESETLRTSLERLVRALNWMLSRFQLEENLNKPAIINVSLGFRPEWLTDDQYAAVLAGFQRVLITLDDLDVLPVVAVGNDGPGLIRAPAHFEESLSVGAVDNELRSAQFSGGGISPLTQQREPDIVGFGVDILSSLERDIAGRSLYADMSGTSMAAPYVTGIAALIAASDPCMHSSELRQRLLQQVLPIDAPPERVGAGLARFAP